MSSNLYKKEIWINQEIDSILSGNIREYDIKFAGFNILKSMHKLTKEQCDYISSLDKKIGHIQIGLLLKKDEALKKALSDGFKLYRKKFIETNELDDIDIMAIRKDAIMTVNKKCDNTNFDYVKFVLKNKYYAYCKLSNNLHVYFDANGKADIKGLGTNPEDNFNKKYKDILGMIWEIYKLASYDIELARKTLSKYANKYVNLELPDGFYREFKPSGEYKLKIHTFNKDYYVTKCINKRKIDINYNYMHVFIPLIRLIF